MYMYIWVLDIYVYGVPFMVHNSELVLVNAGTRINILQVESVGGYCLLIIV